jgi:hypothetical protein
MSPVPSMTAAMPAVTAQDLELEHAELLPARETLMVGKLFPRYYNPGDPCTSIRVPSTSAGVNDV